MYEPPARGQALDVARELALEEVDGVGPADRKHPKGRPADEGRLLAELAVLAVELDRRLGRHEPIVGMRAAVSFSFSLV